MFGIAGVITFDRIVEADFHVARKRNWSALANFALDLVAQRHPLALLVALSGAALSGTVGGCAAGHDAILRRAYEHFDEVVVEAVVDLALEMPGELRMIEIAGMDWKHILVHRHGGVFQIDQNLDQAVRFAS